MNMFSLNVSFKLVVFVKGMIFYGCVQANKVVDKIQLLVGDNHMVSDLYIRTGT